MLSETMAISSALGSLEVPNQRWRHLELRCCWKALKLGSRAANMRNQAAGKMGGRKRGAGRLMPPSGWEELVRILPAEEAQRAKRAAKTKS